jgi:hypothetical protein
LSSQKSAGIFLFHIPYDAIIDANPLIFKIKPLFSTFFLEKAPPRPYN